MFRKIKGASIFDGQKFLPENIVLVTGKDGVVAEIRNTWENEKDIEDFPGIICPGFVNAHCHIELSHLYNKIPQHTGLVNFVQQVISLRNVDEEEKQAAMQKADLAMYNEGIVAVGDICNTADSIPLKQNSSTWWKNFVELSGFVDAGAEGRMEAGKQILQFFDDGLPQFPATLTPHAPYSVGKKLFSLLNTETQHKIISIHNQESGAENELYKTGSGDFLNLYKNLGIDISNFSAPGKNSFQFWVNEFTENQKIISVHNSFTNEEDLEILDEALKKRISFCLCPNANLYIENKLPLVKLFRKTNQHICLGTDSLASNTTLSIVEEMKTISINFQDIPLEEILRWATLNGAESLGIAEQFGSFSPGKKPGIVCLKNSDNNHLTAEAFAERIL